MSYASGLEQASPSEAQAQSPFDFWLAVAERAEWIEEPNARRGGISGMRCAELDGRVFYIKTQTDHCHRSWRHPFGRPTALREAEALEACHRLGVLAPQIVFCGTRRLHGHWQTVLVTHALDGFVDLDRFLREAAPAADPGNRRRLLDSVAVTFARFHAARWQHSAMYDKHVFVAAREIPGRAETVFDVALIDLEKARRRITAATASRHDIRQFQRHCDALDEQDWAYFLERYRAHSGID